jgi:hypothetical protein
MPYQARVAQLGQGSEIPIRLTTRSPSCQVPAAAAIAAVMSTAFCEYRTGVMTLATGGAELARRPAR